MNSDALGRLIKVGDVCGFASRRRSSIFLEPVIIREVLADGVKGDKIVNEYEFKKGWTTKRVPIKLSRVPSHLIITGITEKEAMELMSIRKER